MNKDFPNDFVTQMRKLLEVSEDDGKFIMKNNFEEALSLNDSELINYQIEVINQLSKLDEDEQFSMFKLAIECLCDEFEDSEAKRIMRSRLTAYTYLPRDLVEEDARNTEKFIRKLDNHYYNVFMRRFKETFSELPGNVQDSVRRSYSPAFVSIISY